jgi:NADPH2:quinone reductase
MSTTMDAIVITKFGGPEVLQRQKVPKPVPREGEVLIKVAAFGVNHAEMHMRKGEWDEWNPVTGLECAGIVEAAPGGEFPVGSKVVGVMGGMGRERPGSYGEYVNAPATNVVALDTTLPWEQMAALPIVYCTAYSCIHTVLDVKPGERILVRGATSTIGQGAVHLAVDAGALVTATTRQKERFDWLRSMGAADVKLEHSDLAAEFPAPPMFDKVLNLIGNRVLVESIALTRPHGRMLQAGWLGGLSPVVDFNPIIEMRPGVHFSLFHSKELGTEAFPLSGIPLQEIVRKLERGAWDAKPTRVFAYQDIQAAHTLLDTHKAGGKIVVKH